MDELIPWFHRKLDDAERVAREADPEPTAEDLEFGDRQSVWEDPYGEFHGRSSDPAFAHILQHKPARTLTDIAADRRILAEYERLLFRDPLRVGPAWDARRDTWETAVRMRAEAYDDQPGYQERWRVT